MIGAIVLAAGSSRRFGGDKRKAKLPNGKMVIQQSVETVLTCFDEVTLVLRCDDNEFCAELSTLLNNPKLNIFQAPDSALGMGHSLGNAVREVRSWDGVFVFLADMPHLKVETIELLKNTMTRNTVKPANSTAATNQQTVLPNGAENQKPGLLTGAADQKTVISTEAPNQKTVVSTGAPDQKTVISTGVAQPRSGEISPTDSRAEDSSNHPAGSLNITGGPIVVPVFKGQFGHPVGFAANYFDELSALTGDKGAKPVMNANAGKLIEVAVDDPGVLKDVDTPEDL